MKKVWRVILVIVVISIAVGAVSAGVGVLTGADFDRIGAVFEDRVAEQYNVDLNAFLHEWIPETVGVLTAPLR
ncbi:MAG: hypothetical protein IJT29_05010 [Oscillospiraceae bacterium]|nr:hypothetical protein [Oscillospiraceae bacterium]